MAYDKCYDGLKVYARDGKTCGFATGSTYPCRLEGCSGSRIMVRWSDGEYTWPCSKGLGRGPRRKSLVIL